MRIDYQYPSISILLESEEDYKNFRSIIDFVLSFESEGTTDFQARQNIERAKKFNGLFVRMEK